MWGWLFEQPTAWQEILIGIVLGIVLLYLEDWIDRYRRRHDADERHISRTE